MKIAWYVNDILMSNARSLQLIGPLLRRVIKNRGGNSVGPFMRKSSK